MYLITKICADIDVFFVHSSSSSEIAKQKWGADIHIVSKIIDSETDQSAGESVLIGVIYKEMSLKPSVLNLYYDLVTV